MTVDVRDHDEAPRSPTPEEPAGSGDIPGDGSVGRADSAPSASATASAESRAARVLGPAATVVLSTLAMAQALGVWAWRPGIPLEFDGDASFVLMQVKDILDHGWYWANPDVGAPFGQSSGWFADASWTHYALVKLLGLLSSDPATVSALSFFVGFPLAALAMYALARRVGVGTVAAVVVGVLFSVLPRHQEMFPHLWLAGYWVLPIAMWLVLRAVGRLPTSPRTGVLPRVAVPVAVLVVGLGGVYYVAFTLVLLAAGAAATLAAGRDRRVVVRAATTGVGLGLVCAVPLVTSTLMTRGDVVTGAPPGQRGYWQAETFSGKIIDLVLPWVHHRLPGAAAITANYDAATVASPEQPALGVVALAGVATLAVVGLAYLVGRPRGPLAPLLTTLALLLAVSVAFYTRGGLGALAAVVVTPQIRTWSRLVLVIGLLGLLVVGILLTRLRNRAGRGVGFAVAAVVLVLGVGDQTNPARAPDYANLAATRAAVGGYVDRLERELPAGCSVFQAPVMPFPENAPIGDMKDYDQLRSYVVSTGLRWSYGAMRGTAAADWQLALPSLGETTALTGDLAAAGFCALEVDRAGLADPASTVSALQAQLGAPLSTSSDGRLVAFDLRTLRSALLSSVGDAAVRARGDEVLRRLPARS